MKALILIDIQNDFLAGGSLAVHEGNEIIPVVNKLLKCPFDAIVATKDWHPADHSSFAKNHQKLPGEHVLIDGLDQILWPVHCVQGGRGSEISSEIDSAHIQHIIYKGVDRNIDSYSAFFDNGKRKKTDLDAFLKELGITDIYIVGLATDYCVKFSVLDALGLGYNVFVIQDACRGVNLHANDSERAIEEMRDAGAKIVNAKDVL